MDVPSETKERVDSRLEFSDLDVPCRSRSTLNINTSSFNTQHSVPSIIRSPSIRIRHLHTAFGGVLVDSSAMQLLMGSAHYGSNRAAGAHFVTAFGRGFVNTPLHWDPTPRRAVNRPRTVSAPEGHCATPDWAPIASHGKSCTGFCRIRESVDVEAGMLYQNLR